MAGKMEPVYLSADPADWDDTECVSAWDDAVEEYKKYHSIRARGITVDQALAEFEADRRRREEEDKHRNEGPAVEEPSGVGSESQLRTDSGAEPELEAVWQRVDGTTTTTTAKTATTTTTPAGPERNDGMDVDPDEPSDEAGRQQLDTVAPGPAGSAGSGTTTGPVPAPVPAMALDMVADEPLKNLMMSWYYAGYYTGLYEGQKRGQAGAGADTGSVPSAPAPSGPDRTG